MVSFGDAGVGAVVSETLKACICVTQKAIFFDSTRRSFENRVTSLSGSVKKINELHEELDHQREESEELTKIVEKGQKLIQKSSRIPWYKSIYLRPYFAYKITQMEKDNFYSFGVGVQAQQRRDTLEVLSTVRNVNDKVNSIERVVSERSNKTGSLGCFSVPSLKSQETFGLAVPLKEVKMQVLDERVQIVVVSGPGGGGKTTLVKMLGNDPQIQAKFNGNIFFVTVGKAPTIQAIIRGMFEHNGYPVPDFQTDEHAVHQLEDLLKKIGPNPILLVLDDVWSSSTSSDLVENFRFQLPGYKILVTSRFVFPEPCFRYHLKLLNDENSMRLFRYFAFGANESSSVPDEEVVGKIVRGCKGLPLALKVVGNSLRGRPAESWNILLTRWSQGSILESSNKVLQCLKSSLDFLDLDGMSDAKECFMDLAAFPEDQRIPVTALMDMWAALYGPDENEAKAIDIVYELASRNLLDLVITGENAGQIEGCYSEHFVSLHDLLRELAVYESSLVPHDKRERLFIEINGNDFPACWTDLRQQSANARLLSITTDEMFSSKWCDIQAPEVEVLVLNFRTKSFTLPHFIEKMKKLKVLIITNYGTSVGELSNFELVSTLPSLKRIRLEHISTPLLTSSTSHLKDLQKLSLVMCKIGHALGPNTIGISDVLPNLVGMSIDSCNDLRELPDDLCDILSLKKLSITNCHKLPALPKRIGNLEKLDELRLHSCTGLLELPQSIGSLQKLRFLDISNCLSIRKLPNEMANLCNLRKLYMGGCSGLSELPESFINLKQPMDVIGDEETALLWECLGVNVKIYHADINLNWLPSLSS